MAQSSHKSEIYNIGVHAPVADLGGGAQPARAPPFETFFYKCPPFLYMCPPFWNLKRKKKRCLIPPGYTPVATYPPPPPRRRWRSGKKSVWVPPPPAYQLFLGLARVPRLAAVRKKQYVVPPLSQIPGSAPGSSNVWPRNRDNGASDVWALTAYCRVHVAVTGWMWQPHIVSKLHVDPITTTKTL